MPRYCASSGNWNAHSVGCTSLFSSLITSNPVQNNFKNLKWFSFYKLLPSKIVDSVNSVHIANVIVSYSILH